MPRHFIAAVALITISGACAAQPTETAPPPGPVLANDLAWTMVSDFDLELTLERVEAALETRPLTVFDRIDHAMGAREAGLELAPATLFIFGNPEGGTPLMQQDIRLGLQLPLKLLVYEKDGLTYLSWPNMTGIAEAYGLGGNDTAARMAEMLQSLAVDASKAR